MIKAPTTTRRVGMIVPSSNVTMETELPDLLRRREHNRMDRFTCHGSRLRLKQVTQDELLAMNRHAEAAAVELADAEVDVVLYACLVAVMVEGAGAHRRSEQRIRDALTKVGSDAPVVTSAGALVTTLQDMNAGRIGMIAPYMPTLTRKVSDYLGNEGIEVVKPCSLCVSDNAAVGRLDPEGLITAANELPRDVDAIVLSACVQMPSLAAIATVEERLGVPVISAATATLYQALKCLDLAPAIDGVGALLAQRRSDTLAWAS